ncbi:MAG: PepSY-associated TM helix domain-containing protein [Saprospiraceae bacterium]
MANSRKKKWRYWFRVIHRDVGYFLFGMTIIYSVSGIALNHINDFNPSYDITKKHLSIDTTKYNLQQDEDILSIVDVLGETANYKKHKTNSKGQVKVYLEKGSIIIRPSGDIDYEKFTRRPILYQVNLLHYNPGKLYTWFADAFAVGLILLAITGIFVVKGKHSISRIGLIYTLLGIIIPLLFLYFYYR